jgi:hypothetical protein
MSNYWIAMEPIVEKRLELINAHAAQVDAHAARVRAHAAQVHALNVAYDAQVDALDVEVLAIAAAAAAAGAPFDANLYLSARYLCAQRERDLARTGSPGGGA